MTPSLVAEVLGSLEGAYQWVVLDGPSRVDEVALAVLDSGPEILLLVTPELASVRNAGQLLQLLRDLEFNSSNVHIVLNRADRRSPVSVEVIERNLGMKVAACIPDDTDAVRRAGVNGVPVLQGGRGKPVARALQGLVDELQGNTEAVPQRGLRIWGREARWAMG